MLQSSFRTGHTVQPWCPCATGHPQSGPATREGKGRARWTEPQRPSRAGSTGEPNTRQWANGQMGTPSFADSSTTEIGPYPYMNTADRGCLRAFRRKNLGVPIWRPDAKSWVSPAGAASLKRQSKRS